MSASIAHTVIETPTQTFVFGEGAAFIISKEYGRCACGRAAYFFINRNGVTHCFFCDPLPGSKEERGCIPT